MLEWLPELLGSAATGGVLGVVGNVVKSFMHSRDEAIKHKQSLEIAKVNADAQVRIAQATQQTIATSQVEVAQAAAETAKANSEALDKQVRLAAVKAEGNLNKAGDGFADSVRKLIRPFLTIYMVIFMTALTFQVDDGELYKYLVMQVVMLASAGFLFWFGDRPKSAR